MRRLVQCIAMVGLLSLFAAAVAGMAWAITAGPDDMKGGALLAFVVAALLMMRGWLALLAKAGAHPLGVVVAGLVALFFTGTVPAALAGDDEPVSGVDASVLAGVALGLLTLASLGLIIFGRPDS
ncbi:hypothetical protein [Nonomuraea sp. B5E05]|uniref:hypothetical protein n=1 Tax=Nonomuraea sp. B5E05 TaxID=3153569 RepID=UPI00326117D8